MNASDLLTCPDLLRAWDERGFVHIKQIDLPRVTWDHTIDMIDYNMRLHSEGRDAIKQYPLGGCACYYCHLHENVAPFHSIVKQFAQAHAPTATQITSHAYISMSGISQAVGEHTDPTHDVFIWQQIGDIGYVIDKTVSVYLQPGDVLYMTKGIVHRPIITMPRVTISSAIEYIENGV